MGSFERVGDSLTLVGYKQRSVSENRNIRTTQSDAKVRPDTASPYGTGEIPKSSWV